MKIQERAFVDELDIFLIKKIDEAYKKDLATNTWFLAKLFVAEKLKNSDIEKVYSKNSLDVEYIYRRINYKLKQYQKKKIVKISKNGGGEEILILNLDYISFAKHKFNDGYKECILISAEKIPITF